jgi:hypothetical protein
MNTVDAINNLEYQVYKNLWKEFWIKKLGYNPADRKMTIRVISLKQARVDDEEIRKEFVKFYKNKINEYSFFIRQIK